VTLPTYEQASGTAREGSPFSNSTEGECWMEANCYRCVHDKPAREDDPGNGCPLILVALLGRTPAEWIEDKPFSLAERYRCMYFRDEDDGGDPEPKPVPDPPGQLTLAPREPYEAARMLTGYPQLEDVMA
jgi:hypothetical protein